MTAAHGRRPDKVRTQNGSAFVGLEACSNASGVTCSSEQGVVSAADRIGCVQIGGSPAPVAANCIASDAVRVAQDILSGTKFPRLTQAAKGKISTAPTLGA